MGVAPKNLVVTDLGIAVVIRRKFYQTPETNGSLREMVTVPLDQTQQNSMAQTISQSVKDNFAQNLNVSDKAQFRILVLAPDSPMAAVWFDSQSNPHDVMPLQVYLLDSKSRTILWYTNKVQAIGTEPGGLANFAALSVNKQLDLLLGQAKAE
jgi:hypothetical protein